MYFYRASSCLLLLAALLVSCGGSPEPAAQPEGEWTMHVIDGHLRNSDGLEMADLNNDGLPDYCTAWEIDQAITIGIHPGPDGLSQRWPTAKVATVGDSDEAIFFDWDGDGNQDVVYVKGPDMPVSGIGITWNPGPDKVLEEEAWQDGGLIPATEPLKKFLVLLPTDMDGQGGIDMVAAGTMATPVVWIETPGENRRDLSQYKVHPIFEVANHCWTAALTDLDGDGDLDVAMAESDANHETFAEEEGVRWLENPGRESGKQKQPWQAHLIRHMEIERRAELVAADLDQDGQDDLLFNGRGQIDWWRKTSNEPSWEHFVIPRPANVATRGMGLAVRDINGDGRLDLVVNSVNNEHVPQDKMAVYWMEWTGSRPGTEWNYHVIKWGHGPDHKGIGERWERIRFADMDGDGDQDILMNEKELWTGLPEDGPGGSIIGIAWFENRL